MKAVITLLVALLWLAPPAGAQTGPAAKSPGSAQPMPEDPVANRRAVDLAAQLRCLVCQNQSIADSNAELAVDLRRQIREQIAQGRSDAEITAFMVERYGQFVLYRPPVNPATLLLWLGPPVLLLLGLAVLIAQLRARRARTEGGPLSADERRRSQALLDGVGAEEPR